MEEADTEDEVARSSECGISRSAGLRARTQETRVTIVISARHGLVGPVRGRASVTLSIIEGDCCDLAASPNYEPAYGREYDADEEEGGQHGLGCQDRLPSLEPLLLESGILERKK